MASAVKSAAKAVASARFEPGHHRSEQGAREHVARAVQHVGQLGVGGFREVDGRRPTRSCDEAVAVLDALQHHVLRAALAQLQDHLTHRGSSTSAPCHSRPKMMAASVRLGVRMSAPLASVPMASTSSGV